MQQLERRCWKRSWTPSWHSSTLRVASAGARWLQRALQVLLAVALASLFDATLDSLSD